MTTSRRHGLTRGDLARRQLLPRRARPRRDLRARAARAAPGVALDDERERAGRGFWPKWSSRIAPRRVGVRPGQREAVREQVGEPRRAPSARGHDEHDARRPRTAQRKRITCGPSASSTCRRVASPALARGQVSGRLATRVKTWVLRRYHQAHAPRPDIDRLRGEMEELFADLWQVPRFTRQRAGLPAADRLLPHRATRRAHGRRRARRRRPGEDPDRRRRADARRLRRAAPAAARRPRVPADGDRLRARSASGRAGRRTSTSPARRRRYKRRGADDRAAAARRSRSRPSASTIPIRSRTMTERPRRRSSTSTSSSSRRSCRSCRSRTRSSSRTRCTPLAIGQERSVKLIDDVVARRPPVALVAAKDPSVEQPGLDDLLRGRHRRGRAEDDPRSRRDAAHPRPGPPTASGSSSRVQDEPYLVGRFEEVPDVYEESPELRGADAERADALRPRSSGWCPTCPRSSRSPPRTSTTRARSATSSPRRCG